MKKIAIHQPNFLPWMGLFHKIYCADLFIFLDDAQYSNQGEHNRNLIKTPNGKLLLTVPVTFKLGTPINEVSIVKNTNWIQKHLRTIEMNYKKSKFFYAVYPIIEEILKKDHYLICDLNIELIMTFARKFGMTTDFIRSSSFPSSKTLDDRVIELCILNDGKIYLSGNGARIYQTSDKFNINGLLLEYQKYEPLQYCQIWGDFIYNLSFLDYVMNNGFTIPESWNKE